MKNIFINPTIKAPVLIIEDERDIREILKQALELEGYCVFVAANGKEGLELLSKIPRPCIILLDLMMPIMNGWEFIEALHGQSTLSKIPIVVLTAYGDTVKPIKVKDLLRKPIDLDTLFKTIGTYC